MSERPSRLNKGKQAVRRATKTVTRATDTLSGKSVEQQVSEYSELYTRVLLGIHGDLETQDRRLRDQASEIEKLNQHISTLHKTRILAIAAFAVAMVSAGGALWAIL